MISLAQDILEEYFAAGFVLSLRQLFYQFVARGHIANNVKEYKRLGGIVGDARLAGYIDWAHIEDRSRNLAELQHFDGPQDALDKLKDWYHVDMWEDQEFRPECWIEKDALSGVIAGVCQENDVPYFSCRGYTILSEMYGASRRLIGHAQGGQMPYIIHLGDHDPSGIDMSRDIYDRLRDMFMSKFEFIRVALNMDQVREYEPPPNPAKTTDSRYQAYISRFGTESWELDALEPNKFRELIELQLEQLRDQPKWDAREAKRGRVKQQLVELAGDWEALPEIRRAAGEAERLKAEVGRLKAKLAKAKPGRNGRRKKTP